MRAAGVFAQRLFDQRLGHVETAGAAAEWFRVRRRRIRDGRLLLFAADEPSLAISIETASTCLGSSLPISCAGLLLRQAHQQHGGFAKVLRHGEIAA